MPEKPKNEKRKENTSYLTPQTLDALRNIEMVARTMVEGSLTGLHCSPYHGFSSEFSEYRKYCPGDSVKYLDWQAYARTDRYYVKRFEDETNTHSYIILDQSGSMGLGAGKNRKFNYACYVAAAFIYLMHRQKDAVGLFTYTDKIKEYFPAQCSRVHIMALLSHLENISPSGTSDAAPCFHRIAETVHRRSIVLIFSDFFDTNPEFLKSLRHFRHKNCEVILFRILDPLETDFPFRGLLEFHDMESDELMEVESEDSRSSYLEALEENTRKIKQICGRMNVSFESFNTKTPFDYALLAYFHKRDKMF